MARFYISFDNTNKSNPGQPGYNDGTELAYGYRYKRLTLLGDPTALRNALITARDNLSNALYDNTNGLELANRNGTAGVIIPLRSTTGTLNINRVEGGTTTFTSAYTNSDAVVTPGNYYNRPTSEIYTDSAGSVSLSDPGSFSDSLWVSANNALEDFLSNIADLTGTAGGGPKVSDYYIQYHTDSIAAGGFGSASPYGSDVLTPTSEPSPATTYTRRIYSFHHDPDLTWFAWDDFVPGYVRGPSGGWTEPGNPNNTFPSTPNQFLYTEPIPVNITWDASLVFYPSDRDCELLMRVYATRTTGTNTVTQLVGTNSAGFNAFRNVTLATGATEVNNIANVTLSSTSINLSSLTVGDSVTITTSSNSLYSQFIPGGLFKISYDGSNYFTAYKTSWNGTTKELVVQVKTIVGTGTYTSWTINNLTPYLDGYYSLTIKGSTFPQPISGTENYKLTAEMYLKDPKLGIIGPPMRGNVGIVAKGGYVAGMLNETIYETNNNFFIIAGTP